MDDRERTIPAPIPRGAGNPGRPPPVRPQTVGDVASKAIAFYLEAAGYDVVGREEFDDYWQVRRERERCASWYAVRLARASQGMRPVMEDRIGAIEALGAEIDRLPEPDRTWTLLWLCGSAGWEHLSTETALVEDLAKLGPKRLLLLLSRKIETDDPDLKSSPRGAARYKRMVLLILVRARELLRPEDAEILLACEQREIARLRQGSKDATVSPLWAIAAAELRPDVAETCLRSALGRFRGSRYAEARAVLSSALWRLVGRSQAEFLTYWFYEEAPLPGEPVPARLGFLRMVERMAEPDGRPLVANLLRDHRFGNLWGKSLEGLISIVNSFTKEPVIAPDELAAASNPVTAEILRLDPGRAHREHPRETEEVVRRHAGWRERLRASIPQWAT